MWTAVRGNVPINLYFIEVRAGHTTKQVRRVAIDVNVITPAGVQKADNTVFSFKSVANGTVK